MSELPYCNYFDVKPKRITTNRLKKFIVHPRTLPDIFPTRNSCFIWTVPYEQINPQHQHSTSSKYHIHRESCFTSLLCRTQWPRGLRSTAVRLLGSWVRIPAGAWTFVCCKCCVCSQVEVFVHFFCRSQWQRGPRRRSTAVRLLG